MTARFLLEFEKELFSGIDIEDARSGSPSRDNELFSRRREVTLGHESREGWCVVGLHGDTGG